MCEARIKFLSTTKNRCNSFLLIRMVIDKSTCINTIPLYNSISNIKYKKKENFNIFQLK